MEHKRNTPFAERICTRIWDEQADPDNAWVAVAARCHGYSLADMVNNLSFVDTLHLLLKGELPTPSESALLQKFMVAFCNPGPRHAATRAVMNAAASGTRSANLPAIGLAVLSGEHLGSGEVEQAAHFIRRNLNTDPRALAAKLLALPEASTEDGERRVAPGFGTLFGARDPIAANLAGLFRSALDDAPALDWLQRFVDCLHGSNCGWLMPGVAAAVATELGFPARTAGLLFQLANLPGLIAHGLEMSGKGITAMPFVADENYVLLDNAAT